MKRSLLTVPLIVILTVMTHGLLLLALYGTPLLLDVAHAVTRDRRRRYTPFALTRWWTRALFGRRRPRAITAVPTPPVQRGAPGERNSRYIPQAVKVAVAARDQGRCVYCDSTEDLQFDHKLPWSRGGSATVNNIQLVCGPCNRRKGASV